MIDMVVKFICKQDETIHVHKLEKQWIELNYDTYRIELQKKKESIEDLLPSLGKETIMTVLDDVNKKITETKKKKDLKKLEKEYAAVIKRIDELSHDSTIT